MVSTENISKLDGIHCMEGSLNQLVKLYLGKQVMVS